MPDEKSIKSPNLSLQSCRWTSKLRNLVALALDWTGQHSQVFPWYREINVLLSYLKLLHPKDKTDKTPELLPALSHRPDKRAFLARGRTQVCSSQKFVQPPTLRCEMWATIFGAHCKLTAEWALKHRTSTSCFFWFHFLRAHLCAHHLQNGQTKPNQTPVNIWTAPYTDFCCQRLFPSGGPSAGSYRHERQ